MRSTKAILPVAMAVVTVACAPQESLNPLCTNAEAVADPVLTGLWQETGGGNDLEIHGMWQSLAAAESDDDPPQSVAPEYRTYSVVYVEGRNKRAWSFDGRVIHLGEDAFMDITSRETPVDSDFRYFPLVRSLDGEQPQFTRISEMFYMALLPSPPDENGGTAGDTCELKLIAAHTFLKLTLEDDRLRVAGLDREWLRDMIRDGRISIEHQPAGDALLLTASPEALQDLVQRFSNDSQAFKEIGEWRRKR